jgi:glycosyltransferase involved in cell wall biosynthesis
MVDVSVIVPLYNKSKYVENCIKCLLNQTLRSVEFIIVDDCSVDNSLELVNAVTRNDDRFKIIRHETNRSTHISRYDGVMASSGDYIMFVDADDELEPTLCEYALQEIVKNRADILHFDTIVHGRNNTIPQEIQNHTNFVKPYKNPLECSVLESFLKGDFTWNLWNKIYRTSIVKAAFQEIGPIKMWFTEDYLETYYIAFFSEKYSASE